MQSKEFEILRQSRQLAEMQRALEMKESEVSSPPPLPPRPRSFLHPFSSCSCSPLSLARALTLFQSRQAEELERQLTETNTLLSRFRRNSGSHTNPPQSFNTPAHFSALQVGVVSKPGPPDMDVAI